MSEGEKKTQIKKPGRPRKKIINEEETTIKGVINAPNNDKHNMELIYNDPRLFKKMFSMFKGYYVDDVYVYFKTNNVYIIAKDHTKKTIINIIMDCNKLTEYYCKFPFEICIKREYFEKIFSTIEKSHSKIVLFSSESNYQSTLEINLLNEDVSIHDNYIIDLSLPDKHVEKELVEICEVDKSSYIINFSIKSKSFKKFINDTSANSKIMCIEKLGSNNLTFKMCFSNRINFTRTVINDRFYSIESKIKESEYFNINLELDYIKPFSNMNISDDVKIYIDKNKRAVFECIVGDDICTINIHNDIINYVTEK